MKKAADRAIRSAAPLPAIKLGARQANGQASSRRRVLVVFMRVVSLLWMVEGLAQWAAVVGSNGLDDLQALSAQRLTMIIFFCVLDLIAAIGLWLATSWGGVVWIVTILGQLASIYLLPGLMPRPLLMAISDIVLVAAYVSLNWLVDHDIERQN